VYAGEEIDMTKRVWALVLGIVLSAGWAYAADVDGRWTGSMTTPGGEVPVTFVFKAEGEKLTGAMIGMDGNEIPIADGKIEGDKISYSVTLDFGGMPFQMLYQGVVTPAEITLDGSVFDMPFQLVVKKEP
jgi:hypothetical protein